MNPFQSIANYLNNDLYRWEDDEERKRRYDEMYPMGDAHLGTWDELSRARVRRVAEDTGPPGYDASIQDNVLETKTVTTPTGTTITKKLAPSPVGNAEPNLPTSFDMPSRNAAHVQSMRDRHYGYNRGEPDLPVSWSIPPSVSNVEPNLRTQFPAPAAPSPDVAYPFEGSQGTSMRQGGDMMHALALQASARNQKSPTPSPISPYEGSQGRPMFDPDVVGPAAAHSRALQAASQPQPRPYTGGNVSGVPTPPMPVQPPTTYPDAGGMNYQNRSINDIRGDIQAEQFNQARAAQPAYGGPGIRGFTPPPPTYPDAGGMQLQNRNEGQIRGDLEAERNRISRLERERGLTARAINTLTRDQAASEEARATPAYDELVEEPITGDIYTDAVIDFVGRDAEKDERGMKDWYSQMAREAIRKFNKPPTDEKVTPVYKKKKASGPSRRSKRTGTTSSKRKKQRGRGRN